MRTPGRAAAVMAIVGVLAFSATAVFAAPARAVETMASGIATSATSSSPRITTQPQPAYILRGRTNTFAVAATGSNLRYQWYVNLYPGYRGFYIGGASYTPEWIPIKGATGRTYTASGRMPLHGAQFRVVVSNSNGAVTSRFATLRVGTTYLTGSYWVPARPFDNPFRPGHVAIVEDWAVSIDPMVTRSLGDGRNEVTVRVHAYSGPIAAPLYIWTTGPPLNDLKISVFIDGLGRRAADESSLVGNDKYGWVFTASVIVPEGTEIRLWEIWYYIHSIQRFAPR